MSKQETQFRIGGVYRQQDGALVKLCTFKYGGQPEGTGWACPVGRSGGEGYRSLIDGTDTKGLFGHLRDLIPGELTQTASGWVALGAEKQEDAKPCGKPERVDSLGDLLRQALDRGIGKPAEQSELRKVEPTSVGPNAAMIARDQRPQGTVPGRIEFDPFKGFRVGSNHIWQVGEERADHASPFGIFRNPDACNGPSDHLNASRHQMAGMSKS